MARDIFVLGADRHRLWEKLSHLLPADVAGFGLLVSLFAEWRQVIRDSHFDLYYLVDAY
jgi:hypothetical protein